MRKTRHWFMVKPLFYKPFYQSVNRRRLRKSYTNRPCHYSVAGGGRLFLQSRIFKVYCSNICSLFVDSNSGIQAYGVINFPKSITFKNEYVPKNEQSNCFTYCICALFEGK